MHGLLGQHFIPPETQKPTIRSVSKIVAERTGLEPATSCVTGRHSNQAELPLRIKKMPGNDLLSHSECYTTIGVTAFHFCVRNGNRWFNSTIFTRRILYNLSAYFRVSNSTHKASKLLERCMVKPLGSLVLVRYMHHCTSTPSLSTS